MHFIKACIFSIFISIIVVNIYAQQPTVVWVSPEYDETIAGWDTTHFALIQDGINAVAEAGTVHVDIGVYYEGININKSIHLIGEGPDVTEIDAEGFDFAIYIENVSGGLISEFSIKNATCDGIYSKSTDSLFIQHNICCNNGEVGIQINKCQNITIDNNTVYDNFNNENEYGNGWGIDLSNSHNNLIINNQVNNNWSLTLRNSWGNRIENNVFNAKEASTVSILDNSCNNRIINNEIYGSSCTLVRSMFSHNNQIKNNVFTGTSSQYCTYMAYSSNSIISENDMTGFFQFGIGLYHVDSTKVIGNKIHHPESFSLGGLLFFGKSCYNSVIGNEIVNTPKGISLHHHSDNNQIINNLVQGSSTGIIINTSDNNNIYKNNFVENNCQGFDNGINNWTFNGQGNYWCDNDLSNNYCNNNETAYKIPPNGIDNYPSLSAFQIESFLEPVLYTIPYSESSPNHIYIWDTEIWENENVELTSLGIMNGGSLSIINSTITFSYNIGNIGWGAGGVDTNATLIIDNSEIFFNGLEMNVSKGAKLEIKNSKLYNVGNWEGGNAIKIEAENVVFRDNVIIDAWEMGFLSNSEVVNNTFVNVFAGILIDGTNSLVNNNKIQNTVSYGIHIDGNSNNIYDNTVTDCWENALQLSNSVQSNNIYRNNFISYSPSVSISWNLNNFFINEQGNYYSDYLNLVPSAKKSELFNNQWNLPYPFSWGDNIDEHPSMVCFYTDTVINTPDRPVLLEPDSNVSINTICTTFKWLKDTKTETYRIQISEDSTFSLPVVNKGNIYDTTYCCLLDTNKTYYWRVISVNDGGHSQWSETWQFDTNSVTGMQTQNNNQIPKKFALYQNYPNPFNPSTTIQFDLPRQAEVTLKVFALSGREVDTIISKKLSAGSHMFEWNAEEYASGIYFYKLIADNYIEIKKLILLK